MNFRTGIVLILLYSIAAIFDIMAGFSCLSRGNIMSASLFGIAAFAFFLGAILITISLIKGQTK